MKSFCSHNSFHTNTDSSSPTQVVNNDYRSRNVSRISTSSWSCQWQGTILQNILASAELRVTIFTYYSLYFLEGKLVSHRLPDSMSHISEFPPSKVQPKKKSTQGIKISKAKTKFVKNEEEECCAMIFKSQPGKVYRDNQKKKKIEQKISNS